MALSKVVKFDFGLLIANLIEILVILMLTWTNITITEVYLLPLQKGIRTSTIYFKISLWSVIVGFCGTYSGNIKLPINGTGKYHGVVTLEILNIEVISPLMVFLSYIIKALIIFGIIALILAPFVIDKEEKYNLVKFGVSRILGILIFALLPLVILILFPKGLRIWGIPYLIIVKIGNGVFPSLFLVLLSLGLLLFARLRG